MRDQSYLIVYRVGIDNNSTVLQLRSSPTMLLPKNLKQNLAFLVILDAIEEFRGNRPQNDDITLAIIKTEPAKLK